MESILALDEGGEAEATGRWHGIRGIETARYDLSLRFRRDSSSWIGTLDLPALELEEAVLSDVGFSDGMIRFTWDSPQGRFTLAGRVNDDRIVGLASYRGRRFPFSWFSAAHRRAAEYARAASAIRRGSW